MSLRLWKEQEVLNHDQLITSLVDYQTTTLGEQVSRVINMSAKYTVKALSEMVCLLSLLPNELRRI